MSTETYRPGVGLQPWSRTLPPTMQPGETLSGEGTPEGSVPAPVGKLYVDILNGNIYQKESGISELGWVLRGDET